MTKELKAEKYAHLPEHPMEPFLRIIGVGISPFVASERLHKEGF